MGTQGPGGALGAVLGRGAPQNGRGGRRPPRSKFRAQPEILLVHVDEAAGRIHTQKPSSTHTTLPPGSCGPKGRSLLRFQK